MKGSFLPIFSKTLVRLLFFFYFIVLFYTVFVGGERQTQLPWMARINFVPIRSLIRFYQTNPHSSRFYFIFFGEIFGNVFLLFPFGFFIKWLYPHLRNQTVVVYGLLLSIGIELTQLLLQVGICDVDDVLLNTAGTWAGVCFCIKIISRAAAAKR